MDIFHDINSYRRHYFPCIPILGAIYGKHVQFCWILVICSSIRNISIPNMENKPKFKSNPKLRLMDQVHEKLRKVTGTRKLRAKVTGTQFLT